MSAIFDVVIALLIITATAFVLSHILSLVSIVLPTGMATIILFVVAIQVVLFVIHRRD